MEHFTIRRNGKQNIKDSLKYKASVVVDHQRTKLSIYFDKFCYLAEHSTLQDYQRKQ
jgi:hypothetical protein